MTKGHHFDWLNSSNFYSQIFKLFSVFSFLCLKRQGIQTVFTNLENALIFNFTCLHNLWNFILSKSFSVHFSWYGFVPMHDCYLLLLLVVACWFIIILKSWVNNIGDWTPLVLRISIYNVTKVGIMHKRVPYFHILQKTLFSPIMQI